MTEPLRYVVAFNYQEFCDFMSRLNIDHFSDEYRYIGTVADIQGRKLPQRELIKLCNVWMRNDYEELRNEILRSSNIDLDTHPATYV